MAVEIEQENGCIMLWLNNDSLYLGMTVEQVEAILDESNRSALQQAISDAKEFRAKTRINMLRNQLQQLTNKTQELQAEIQQLENM